MYHDHRSDQTGCHAPGGLPYILQLVVLVRKRDVISFRKLLSEEMAGSGLKRTSVMHQCLNGIGCHRTGKFLLVRLLSLDCRDCHILCQKICIHIQHLLRSFLCLFRRCMNSMSFLPQELSGAKERPGLLLPADDGAPLVVHTRQITIGMYIILVKVRKDRLRGRAYAETLCQRLRSSRRDPRYLRGKAVDQLSFLRKKAFRNEQRHVHVLNAGFLESLVQMGLNRLPQCIPRRLENRKALDVGITDQLRLGAHIGIPLGEVLVH